MDKGLPMFDVLIKNGTIVDGTGCDRDVFDIGIKNGKISALGCLAKETAVKEIDARGYCVTPGFIDLHSHSDFTLLLDGRGESFVRQGVTTEVVGNCGLSCAPLRDSADLKRNVFCFKGPYQAGWSAMDGYLAALEATALGINVVPLVGHAAVRSMVMGYARRPASTSEIEKMTAILSQSLDAGAWGFSTGLEYFPGIGASVEEIHALCSVVKTYGGLYTTHVKNRDEQYRKGFGEAFETAAQTGVRLQISHAVPKYGAPENAAEWFLSQLERHHANFDIACDVIPYAWGPTTMTAILPPALLKEDPQTIASRLAENSTRALVKSQKQPFWLLLRDRCWDQIVLYRSEKFRDLVGKNALELAEALHTGPFDALLDVLKEEGDDMFGVLMMGKIKRERDLNQILRHPLSGVISDGVSLSRVGPLKELAWSPGCFGWAPRFFHQFVGNGKRLTVEEGVARITGFPAKRLGLKNRGFIAKGNWADLVVLDLEHFEEKGSLFAPAAYPEGVKHVLINGELTVWEGALLCLSKRSALKKGGELNLWFALK